MVYQIGICDDNETDVLYITSLVKSWMQGHSVRAAIGAFPSAEAFLFHCAEGPAFDILLLDVEMEGMDGVSLAKHIRKGDDSVQIIFITGYPEHMAEGYEVSALHYLIKPVHGQKLSAALDKAVVNLGKSERSILLPVHGERLRIKVSQVISAEAFAHTCLVSTALGRFEANISITGIAALLGDDFIRCHRSYIVGIRYIKSISRTDVTLDNGQKIPLSRSRYGAVNQAFIRYFRGD